MNIKNNPTPFGPRGATPMGLVALALALILTAGCAVTRPKPQVIINPGGDLTSYKRYERFPQRDFFHRIARKAYSTPREMDFDLASPSQETILKEWGRPEYIRKRFRSLQEELVDEWVYFDKQRVYQFVTGEPVFEGQISDFEQLLLRLGYPDRSQITIGETGLVKHSLLYTKVFTPGRFETYKLANDTIVYSYEGN